MAYDQQQDGLLFPRLDLSYNRALRQLDPAPRFVDGRNMYVTYGGMLAKRPGTLKQDNTLFGKRLDRLWIHQTLEADPRIYLLASAYNVTTARWEMYWWRGADAAPAWTPFTSIRDVNSSIHPHEGVSARGLFYIKSYPHPTSSEKLGTVVFNGDDTPQIYPWGLLGPTIPAKVSGTFPRLTALLTDTATTATLTTLIPNVPPFNAYIDFELVTVTAMAGVNITAMTRGVSGTEPANHAAQSVVAILDWAASAHPVTVNIGWTYSYAYKSITGQISNRAPVETNPDNPPSSTGAFLDLIPKIIVQGTADTTNFPTIVLFRTTDGGGTFFVVKEVANTGAGAITIYDTDLASGTGGTVFQDPLPDAVLTDNDFATTLTSNSPPPSTTAPNIVGTDNVDSSSPMAYFAGRIWYGIGNILFYSAQEELTIGIPEESFPSGVRGNFFRFQNPITNMQATSQALYIMTIKETVVLTGSNRETFNAQVLFNDVGHPPGHPRAIVNYRDNIAWLTSDFRIVTAQNNQLTTLSDPLFTDIKDAISGGGEIGLDFFASLEKEWLQISSFVAANPDNTQQWIIDLKKSDRQAFYFVPWEIPATACASGIVSESDVERKLVYYLWGNAPTSQVVYLDPTGRTATDDLPGEEDAPMDCYVTTNLFICPSGNHLNEFRVPNTLPVLDQIQLERTLFTNDTDPELYFYRDNFWSSPEQGPPPSWQLTRKDASLDYRTMVFPINEVAYRTAIQIIKNRSRDRFEIQNFIPIWRPDMGSSKGS